MPINPDAVGSKSQPVERTWDSTDALIYALGVGAGAVDPFAELEFTTENSSGIDQKVLPTMAVVLGFGGGGALGSIGSFNPAMLVHGEQAIGLHGPIPTSGTVSTVEEVVGVYDKGKGAVVVTEASSTDTSTGEVLFTNRASLFIRGEGGWGGDRGPSGPAERGARSRARSHGHLSDPHRPGPPLPAVGRPQPAALRPEVRGDGRVRPADPPRAVHLRVHRTSPPPVAVRWRSGSVHLDGGPLLVPGDARRVAHGQHVGRRRAAPCSAPRATTAASCSTAAAVDDFSRASRPRSRRCQASGVRLDSTSATI